MPTRNTWSQTVSASPDWFSNNSLSFSAGGGQSSGTAVVYGYSSALPRESILTDFSFESEPCSLCPFLPQRNPLRTP